MDYTGIGSRDTPLEVLNAMVSIGGFMAKAQWVLRSGGAKGADSAFETGCDKFSGTKKIYLPYNNFNKNHSDLFGSTIEARQISKLFHPAWGILGSTARDFMGRNVYQILDQSLKAPTEFVVCWTPNGRITGGTGQALRMADHYKIPVYNFGSMSFDQINDAVLSHLS